MTDKPQRLPKLRAPVAEQHSSALQRMREIANQSGDALYLSNAPVHPDHVLLGLCADATHAARQAAILMDEYRAASGGPKPWRENRLMHGAVSVMRRHGAGEAAARALRDDENAQKAEDAWNKGQREVSELAQDWTRQATNALRTAAKLRATTPAGIYAKALLVKGSAGSAAVLAMSLADDFLACEGLRASLWPAGEAGA